MIHVYINGDDHQRELYREVEELVLEALRYWNNFGDKKPLELKLIKEPSDDPQIKVEDGINTKDLFGQS